MRERVLTIGQPRPLFGVLCEPEHYTSKKIAVILLNSGVMHRVGSSRISVKIARELSEKSGLASLRFDFSGIGDSPPRRSDGADFGQVAVSEVREVMDYLQANHKFESFILYGLCSGAFTAFQVGLVDDRVRAIAQIDGYSYPTLKSYLYYYLPRVFTAERWILRFRRMFGHKVNMGGYKASSEDPYMEVPEFASMPERKEVAGWLATLVGKKISLFSVFTGKEPYYSYADQYQDCFHEIKFDKLLEVLYLPRASHILTQPGAQNQVVNGIVSWVNGLDCQE